MRLKILLQYRKDLTRPVSVRGFGCSVVCVGSSTEMHIRHEGRAFTSSASGQLALHHSNHVRQMAQDLQEFDTFVELQTSVSSHTVPHHRSHCNSS